MEQHQPPQKVALNVNTELIGTDQEQSPFNVCTNEQQQQQSLNPASVAPDRDKVAPHFVNQQTFSSFPQEQHHPMHLEKRNNVGSNIEYPPKLEITPPTINIIPEQPLQADNASPVKQGRLESSPLKEMKLVEMLRVHAANDIAEGGDSNHLQIQQLTSSFNESGVRIPIIVNNMNDTPEERSDSRPFQDTSSVFHEGTTFNNNNLTSQTLLGHQLNQLTIISFKNNNNNNGIAAAGTFLSENLQHEATDGQPLSEDGKKALQILMEEDTKKSRDSSLHTDPDFVEENDDGEEVKEVKKQQKTPTSTSNQQAAGGSTRARRAPTQGTMQSVPLEFSELVHEQQKVMKQQTLKDIGESTIKFAKKPNIALLRGHTTKEHHPPHQHQNQTEDEQGFNQQNSIDNLRRNRRFAILKVDIDKSKQLKTSKTLKHASTDKQIEDENRRKSEANDGYKFGGGVKDTEGFSPKHANFSKHQPQTPLHTGSTFNALHQQKQQQLLQNSGNMTPMMRTVRQGGGIGVSTFSKFSHEKNQPKSPHLTSKGNPQIQINSLGVKGMPQTPMLQGRGLGFMDPVSPGLRPQQRLMKEGLAKHIGVLNMLRNEAPQRKQANRQQKDQLKKELHNQGNAFEKILFENTLLKTEAPTPPPLLQPLSPAGYFGLKTHRKSDAAEHQEHENTLLPTSKKAGGNINNSSKKLSQNRLNTQTQNNNTPNHQTHSHQHSTHLSHAHHNEHTDDVDDVKKHASPQPTKSYRSISSSLKQSVTPQLNKFSDRKLGRLSDTLFAGLFNNSRKNSQLSQLSKLVSSDKQQHDPQQTHKIDKSQEEGNKSQSSLSAEKNKSKKSSRHAPSIHSQLSSSSSSSVHSSPSGSSSSSSLSQSKQNVINELFGPPGSAAEAASEESRPSEHAGIDPDLSAFNTFKRKSVLEQQAGDLSTDKNIVHNISSEQSTAEYQQTDENDQFEEKYTLDDNQGGLFIKPDSRVKPFWDLIIFVFMIQQSVIIPFQLCFEVQSFQELEEDTVLLYFQLFVDFLFLCDIYVNFITGIYHKGTVILRKNLIAQIYLKSWFIIDLIATIPFIYIFQKVAISHLSPTIHILDSAFGSRQISIQELMFSKYLLSHTGTFYESLEDAVYQSGEEQNAQSEDFFFVLPQDEKRSEAFLNAKNELTQNLIILRVLFLLRMLKLVKIVKLGKIMRSMEELIQSDELMLVWTLSKILGRVLICAHWMACFYWLIGEYELYNNNNDEKRPWPVRPECNYFDLNDVAQQYVLALYWAVQTMCTVGFGDFAPYTVSEQVFVTACMLISAGIYSSTLENVEKTIRKHNQLAEQFREHMLYVHQFMKIRDFPLGLRSQIWQYLQHQWETKKQIKIEQAEVFSLLSQDLQEKITICMNAEIMHMISALNMFTQSQEPECMVFMSQISFFTKIQNFGMDEYIFHEKDIGNSMYYILSGRVAVIHKKTHSYLEDLIREDYFGEIGFFSDNSRCATMKSRDFTELFVIDSDTFLEVAQEYPEVMKIYHNIRNEMQNEFDYSVLQIECYICRQIGHIAIDCDLFPHTKEGNLVKMYNKVFKTGLGDDHQRVKKRRAPIAAQPVLNNPPIQKKSPWYQSGLNNIFMKKTLTQNEEKPIVYENSSSSSSSSSSSDDNRAKLPEIQIVKSAKGGTRPENIPDKKNKRISHELEEVKIMTQQSVSYAIVRSSFNPIKSILKKNARREMLHINIEHFNKEEQLPIGKINKDSSKGLPANEVEENNLSAPPRNKGSQQTKSSSPALFQSERIQSMFFNSNVKVIGVKNEQHLHHDHINDNDTDEFSEHLSDQMEDEEGNDRKSRSISAPKVKSKFHRQKTVKQAKHSDQKDLTKLEGNLMPSTGLRKSNTISHKTSDSQESLHYNGVIPNRLLLPTVFPQSQSEESIAIGGGIAAAAANGGGGNQLDVVPEESDSMQSHRQSKSAISTYRSPRQ